MKKTFRISADIKISKKDKLLNEIRTGMMEVKSIRAGKTPIYTMSDLLRNI